MDFIWRSDHLSFAFTSDAMNLELVMVTCTDDKKSYPPEPVILSIQTDGSGHCVLKSSDGCLGGTFINRRAALREVDDQVCMQGRMTVIVIEPEGTATSSPLNGNSGTSRTISQCCRDNLTKPEMAISSVPNEVYQGKSPIVKAPPPGDYLQGWRVGL